MKKTLLCLVLSIFTFYILASCQPKDPLAEFFNELNTRKNYSVELTMNNFPEIDNSTVIMQRDGNKTVTANQISNDNSLYTEETDECIYYYEQDDEQKWIRIKGVGTSKDSRETFFNFSNYEKAADGTYKIKPGVVEDVRNITLTLENDTCTILCDISEDEFEDISAECKIYDIGKVTVNLPEEYFSEEEAVYKMPTVCKENIEWGMTPKQVEELLTDEETEKRVMSILTENDSDDGIGILESFFGKGSAEYKFYNDKLYEIEFDFENSAITYETFEDVIELYEKKYGQCSNLKKGGNSGTGWYDENCSVDFRISKDTELHLYYTKTFGIIGRDGNIWAWYTNPELNWEAMSGE